MCTISLYASRIGLGWAHDVFTLHVTCSCILHAVVRLFTYSYYCELCWSYSDCFFLSPLYLLVTLVVSMAPKRKSIVARNPLHSSASTSSDHAPLSLHFRNDDAHKAFTENFSQRGIHLERRVILGYFADTDLSTIIHSREWESLCDEPVTCPLVLIQEFYSNMHGIDHSVPHFVTRVWGISIPVTLQLVADVLRVPRIEFPNYPSCERLRTVSKDELMSAFCERPSEWGERQFTYCLSFAKGPRFFNIVMTFVLYPLLHYNSITESRARFLLSLLEHLTIDFPSHFILSLINVFKDLTSRDKLIFPSAITRILRHFFVPFSRIRPLHFHVCHRRRYRKT